MTSDEPPYSPNDAGVLNLVQNVIFITLDIMKGGLGNEIDVRHPPLPN